MHPYIETAHLRIKVETRLNGELISAEDIEENPGILNSLPEKTLVQNEYLKILELAQSNKSHYLINVNEKGINSIVIQE